MKPPATGVRRRPGHKACVACKAVKMRCIRERSDLPCERCTLTEQECRLPDKKPRKSRTGKRLELAKALYGGLSAEPSSDDSSSSSDHNPDTDHMKPMPDLWGNDTYTREPMPPNTPLYWTRHNLSEMSSETSLATAELCKQFSSRLIDDLFVIAQSPLPIKRWTTFRVEFEEAGRVPEQLNSPITQVMAAVLIAKGARVTAAPCVLGNEAVNSDLSKGDLSYFGRRRAAICQALDRRAAQLADERGLFRSESNESIRVLMLLSQHLDHDDPRRKKGRPYRIAAASHARSIVEDCRPMTEWLDLVGGPLGYMLFVQDTWTSASSLMAPTLVEDEGLIRPYVDFALPTLLDLTRALSVGQPMWNPSSSNDSGMWRPISMVWGYVTNLMRHVNHHLRRGPHSAEIWAVIKDSYTRLDEHRKCYQSFRGALSQLFDLRKPGLGLLQHYFTTSPTPNLLITFYIHRAIKYWIETPSVYEMLSSEALVTLTGLKSESDRRMADGARELVRLFDSLLTMYTHRTGLSTVPEVGLMYETLPVWAEVLIAVPTAEDGDPANYRLSEKVKDMTRLLDALHALGWAYADSSLAESIAKLEQYLSAARINMRVQTYSSIV